MSIDLVAFRAPMKHQNKKTTHRSTTAASSSFENTNSRLWRAIRVLGVGGAALPRPRFFVRPETNMTDTLREGGGGSKLVLFTKQPQLHCFYCCVVAHSVFPQSRAEQARPGHKLQDGYACRRTPPERERHKDGRGSTVHRTQNQEMNRRSSISS